jgi:hypothetical protein
MNGIMKFNYEMIEQQSYKSMICKCPLHRGTVVEQISGYLCNGKPIIVLLDAYGYHVDIGEAGEELNLEFPSDPVSRKTALAMIMEAMES